MTKFLFIAFLAIPIVEIYVLISVGSVIGAATTIVLIISTALLGALLVRAQGFATFVRVQAQLAKGEVPAMEILEGLFLLVAGALLLTPGFVTDAIGFAFLTPPLRRMLIRKMLATGIWRGQVKTTYGNSSFDVQDSKNHRRPRGRIIDAEYEDLDR